MLGEHFRSHWDVKPVTYPSDPNAPPILHSHTTAPAPSVPPSEVASTKSSRKPAKSPRLSALSGSRSASSTPVVSATGSAGNGDLQTALAADVSKLSLTARSIASDSSAEGVRVVFLVREVPLMKSDYSLLVAELPLIFRLNKSHIIPRYRLSTAQSLRRESKP